LVAAIAPFTNLSEPFLHILWQNLHMVCILRADPAHHVHFLHTRILQAPDAQECACHVQQCAILATQVFTCSVIAATMFSEELKALRTQLGLTQQAMADRLHVDRSTYCRWEHTEQPPAHVLERISKEFGVDAWAWMRPEEEEPEKIPGAHVVHFHPTDQKVFSDEERAESAWRSKAVDLLSRVTELLANLITSSGKNKGGGVGNHLYFST
jgi:transcriptional regulator with XRE-family HTH domain